MKKNISQPLSSSAVAAFLSGLTQLHATVSRSSAHALASTPAPAIALAPVINTPSTRTQTESASSFVQAPHHPSTSGVEGPNSRNPCLLGTFSCSHHML